MPQALGAILVFGEEFARQAFFSMIQRLGIEKIRSCASCHDALVAVNQSALKWKLLILDSRVPRAYETVRTVRRLIGPHIKILMVFSGPTKEMVGEAVGAGVDDIVTFPVSPATLEKKLQRLVELPQRKFALFKRAANPSAVAFTAKR